MKRSAICTLVAALFTVSCAYHAPDAPTPPPPASTSAPAFLTLGASVGTGAAAGQSTVTAKVQNVNGAPLAGVTVAFQVDHGTIAPAAATTDNNGTATTSMTAAESAKVTASTGSLTTSMLVASQPPVPVPTPVPAPQPPTPTPLGPVSISLSAATVVVGNSTVITANVTGASGVFDMQWDFGDGAAGTSTSSTTAHTYGAAGTYRVTAILRDDTGRSASATTNVVVNPVPVVAPPTPRPLSISATLTCTGLAKGSPTFCNVTVLDQDGAIVTGKVAGDGVQWDFGDGKVNSIGANGVANQYTYPQAGTYTVSAGVTLNGLKTAATKVLIIV